MQSDETIFVFGYRELREEAAEASQLSRYKAARETIARLGGRVIEGTGEEVPVSALDAHGRYRRVATGWGELP
jgi:hypothetical protein